MDLEAKLPCAYIYSDSNLGYSKCNSVNTQGDISVLLSFI